MLSAYMKHKDVAAVTEPSAYHETERTIADATATERMNGKRRKHKAIPETGCGGP
jgi:hypothetical protein